MMLGVVSIEHVLANGGDLRSIAAYRGANVLYDALASQFHLIGLTAASEEVARWWLKRERMPRWARIMAADALGEGDMTGRGWQEWKVTQIRTFLAEGWEIAFFIDCKFGPIEQVHDLGVSTITYEHATVNPGWRDPAQASPRAWEDLALTSEPGGDSHGLR